MLERTRSCASDFFPTVRAKPDFCTYQLPGYPKRRAPTWRPATASSRNSQQQSTKAACQSRRLLTPKRLASVTAAQALIALLKIDAEALRCSTCSINRSARCKLPLFRVDNEDEPNKNRRGVCRDLSLCRAGTSERMEGSTTDTDKRPDQNGQTRRRPPLPHMLAGDRLRARHPPGRQHLPDDQLRRQGAGAPEFAPVMDELNRRKAVVNTHPGAANCCRNLVPGTPDQIIEFGTDTTRTIANPVLSGTTVRSPDIKLIFRSRLIAVSMLGRPRPLPPIGRTPPTGGIAEPDLSPSRPAPWPFRLGVMLNRPEELPRYASVE